MTEVAFHFNAPDKVGYACRLLRKALGTGARAVVTASEGDLNRLNAQLWTFSSLDFLPHAMEGDPPDIVRASPIFLTRQPALAMDAQVLVNLSAGLPEGFERYPRVIEVVSLNEEDRAQARQRWKAYTGRGYLLKRHDLAIKPDT